MTRKDIEQWVKEHPIQWEETTADDQYGNEYKIIFERYYVLAGANLFYVIDEISLKTGTRSMKSFVQTTTDSTSVAKRFSQQHETALRKRSVPQRKTELIWFVITCV